MSGRKSTALPRNGSGGEPRRKTSPAAGIRLLIPASLALLGLMLVGMSLLMLLRPAEEAGSGAFVTAPQRPTTALPADPLKPLAATSIKAVWANDGGDKVLQEETRSLASGGRVLNSLWDGRRISLFGARNEVVSVALILETADSAAKAIDVRLPELVSTAQCGDKAGDVGPVSRPPCTRGCRKNSLSLEGEGRGEGENNGLSPLPNPLPRGERVTAMACTKAPPITDRPVSRTVRYADIEPFHVGYLQIRGLSRGLAWDTYDERHIPSRCRRPLDRAGEGTGGWRDRPCADRHFPDIAVPLAARAPFSIAPHRSQMIWFDIYIPERQPAGTYRGTITIREQGKRVWAIPVVLEVLDFMLPDRPSARTMVAITTEDIAERYLGKAYPDPDSAAFRQLQQLIDRHYQMAHRHRLSLVEGHAEPEQMQRYLLPRLDGSLFTPARGYRGPGEGVGNNVYAIGLFGFWPWKSKGRAAMWENADRWVRWFRRHGLENDTEYFLYLDDESENHRQLEQWAGWLRSNPGPGRKLASMATVDLLAAVEKIPSLTIVATMANIGERSRRAAAARRILEDPDRRLYLYNGRRPATGSFAIEDDGVALRQLGWTQFKLGINRWFYWNGTYYNNVQCAEGDASRKYDLYRRAQTFGCNSGRDPLYGETGYNYFNGDGVLFYPGVDRRFPDSAPGIDEPVAALRLKHWRRGLQDVEYLTLARRKDPEAVRRIVAELVPKVVWEYGVSSRRDPTWVRADISWPIDPDRWEAARKRLARIIVGARG